MTAPCMGGWCALRDKCPRYDLSHSMHQPVERQCIPGRDGVERVYVDMHRPEHVSVFTGRAVDPHRLTREPA